MITGDYVKTAIAIAKRVNIILPEDDVEECACDCNKLRPNGPDYIPEAEMDDMTKKVRCFARAKPEDKLMIVKSLQRQGFVSAMTGDGVNDAPALSEAMIGVAMGEAGTEVAKGAAEMVLQDDNFTRIVDAVEKGRVIYAGIQKFVAFIMSVHIAEVVQIFVCVVAQIPIMRTPLQILFLILVTDLPPSIALGMEPGEAGILKQPPRPRDEPVVLNWMWISMTVNGLLLSAVIIGVYIWALLEYPGFIFNKDFPENNYDCDTDAGAGKTECEEWEKAQTQLMYARTVAFISLVFSENARAYISRSFEKPVCVNFLGNKWMQVAVVSALCALTLAVIILPLITEKILMLDALSIGGKGWGIALVGPVATTILCEIWKVPTGMMKRRYDQKVRSDQLRIAGEDSDSSSGESSSASDSDGL
jgi:magnesium-transporting ATPase (P-type)